jgi:hypothetical protein
MPPYTKPVSEAQRRMMFVLERQGKLKKGEARGKSRALRGKKLPMHKRAKGRKKGRR